MDNGAAFDKAGDLWVTNSRVKNGIKVLHINGQWQKYSTDKILASEDNSFFEWSLTEMESGWVQIVME
jgi:hypothetical protein